MRFLCLLLVLLFLPSGLFNAAAESADDRLSAALEALGAVSVSVEGEFPGITASAGSSLSAEDAQALLDSALPLVAAQDTCRVYQGTGDFLLFATSNNAADWNVQYVINADHNVLTPCLIKCVAEFGSKRSQVQILSPRP